jgi:1,5-anhydro-D-fructose reductase (1,5-anhydro-D-mannitol-forming)
MTLGWGIIGTGRHADTAIAPAIAAQGDAARLVGVVSRDPARAEAFARRHAAPGAYTRYEDLLANPDVDVVLVTSPNGLHAEHALAAARAGKHVLCDKPLATSSDDAAQVVKECRRAGVRLGIDFQVRHLDSSAATRRLIASGAIGEVLLVQAEHGPGRHPLASWRTDPRLAGLGATNNLAVHAYDLLRYLLESEVMEVTAMFDTGQSGDLEEMVTTLLRFNRGAMAYVNGNQTVPHRQNDFVVYGSRGRIVGKSLTRHMQDGELRAVTGQDEREEVHRYATHDAFVRVVADMHEAVSSGRDPLASGVDGLRSVELTEAVAESARQGRLVRPRYRDLEE